MISFRYGTKSCNLLSGHWKLTKSSTSAHTEQQPAPDGNGSHSLQKQLWFQSASSCWKGFFILVLLTQSFGYPAPIKFISFPSLAPSPFPQFFSSLFFKPGVSKVLSKSAIEQWFWSNLMQVKNEGGVFFPITGIQQWSCLWCNYSW